MEKDHTTNHHAFTDLASYQALTQPHGTPFENVIKGAVVGGTSKVEVSDSAVDQPTVIVRKEHDVVESIEFVCRCGRSTAVHFDYEGE